MGGTPATRSTYLSGERAVACAQLIATLAHHGQADKCGVPYSEHPAAVARLLVEPTWAEQVVAWLHDVVEDTPVTLDALAEPFGPVIAAALDAITHRRHEPLDAYCTRVGANPLALAVKLADLAHNNDPARLAQLDEATRHRLQDKYTHDLTVLRRTGAVWTRTWTRTPPTLHTHLATTRER